MKVMVTFSLYSHGQLVDRRYVTDEDDLNVIHDIGAVQANLIDAIDRRGGTYLMDLEYWDGEHVRWGTEPEGMVIPIEVGPEGLTAAINRVRKERGTD